MADGIKVRFANLTDLDGCIALDDPNLSAEIIGRKIAQHEIILPEPGNPQAKKSLYRILHPLGTIGQTGVEPADGRIVQPEPDVLLAHETARRG